MAATGIAADIAGIVALPLPGFVRSVPDNLGVGANQDILTPALQTLTVGGIQDFIFFPFIGNPKHMGLLLISVSFDLSY
jgi:hypothetical protein